MENYEINITINEYLMNSCSCTEREIEKVFTNTNNFFNLKCDYSIKIENVNQFYVTISINNLIYHIIRKIYINIPIRICISECPQHKIIITLNSINILN